MSTMPMASHPITPTEIIVSSVMGDFENKASEFDQTMEAPSCVARTKDRSRRCSKVHAARIRMEETLP
jgi:hypothetical protein